MKNHEQIRAKNALKALEKYPSLMKAGREGGDHLTGFPALIITNGLLASIAFSLSKGKKSDDYVLICNAIAEHLADPAINLLDKEKKDVEGMKEVLTESGLETLRLCTAEALAYLNYLRRFAKAEN